MIRKSLSWSLIFILLFHLCLGALNSGHWGIILKDRKCLDLLTGKSIDEDTLLSCAVQCQVHDGCENFSYGQTTNGNGLCYLCSGVDNIDPDVIFTTYGISSSIQTSTSTIETTPGGPIVTYPHIIGYTSTGYEGFNSGIYMGTQVTNRAIIGVWFVDDSGYAKAEGNKYVDKGTEFFKYSSSQLSVNGECGPNQFAVAFCQDSCADPSSYVDIKCAIPDNSLTLSDSDTQSYPIVFQTPGAADANLRFQTECDSGYVITAVKKVTNQWTAICKRYNI